MPTAQLPIFIGEKKMLVMYQRAPSSSGRPSYNLPCPICGKWSHVLRRSSRVRKKISVRVCECQSCGYRWRLHIPLEEATDVIQ